jgi:hypothetical protein
MLLRTLFVPSRVVAFHAAAYATYAELESVESARALLATTAGGSEGDVDKGVRSSVTIGGVPVTVGYCIYAQIERRVSSVLRFSFSSEHVAEALPELLRKCGTLLHYTCGRCFAFAQMDSIAAAEAVLLSLSCLQGQIAGNRVRAHFSTWHPPAPR